jgi:hypothetical protein
MSDHLRSEVAERPRGASDSNVSLTGSTQIAECIPTSEWDYSTIAELNRALHARKISAAELVDHAIARIETLDRRLNAVVVRDFERAQGFRAGRRRVGGFKVEECGCGNARQDQCSHGACGFSKLQRHLRDDQQSLGYSSLAWRLVGGIRRRGGRRFRTAIVRIGHWRIAAHPRAFLRRLCA